MSSWCALCAELLNTDPFAAIAKAATMEPWMSPFESSKVTIQKVG